MLFTALRRCNWARSAQLLHAAFDGTCPTAVCTALLHHLQGSNATKTSLTTRSIICSSERGYAEEQKVMTVDRSGMYADAYAEADSTGKQQETELIKHLKAIIHYRGGPITVAEYMSEALTNAKHGYYIQQEVFGGKGDFITSPEISQVYGEMVGVWCVAFWQQQGSPSTMRIVELGPGKGTLMADLLRGTSVFKDFAAAVEVHMVEVSDSLRSKQYDALQCKENADGSVNSALNGAKVVWHRSLDKVPTGIPTLYIAHEFLDALPVHQFQLISRDQLTRLTAAQQAEKGEKLERISPLPRHRGPLARALQGAPPGPSSIVDDLAALDMPHKVINPAQPARTKDDELLYPEKRKQPGYEWRERLVDSNLEPDTPHHFRFVLSPNETPASTLLLKRRLQQLGGDAAELTAIEICPQALALAQTLAQRVASEGGAALLIDYGRDSPPYGDSLQALREHDVVSPLDSPGTADLSAWVDFGAIRSEVNDLDVGVACHGPITQQQFLMSLGVVQRLQVLLEQAADEEAQNVLMDGVRRLVEGNETDGMGISYKCMVLTRENDDIPVPFASKCL